MTFKHQYKVMIGLMVLLVHAFIANAQDEEKRNTGESLGKQFLNNRVPGMQYAPEKPKAQRRATIAEQQENHSESSGMQLKKGTIRGMRFEGGSGFTPNAARRTVRAQAAGGTLSSDQKAEQRAEPAGNRPVAPAQGNVKEPLEHKSAPDPRGKAINPEAMKKATTEKKD